MRDFTEKREYKVRCIDGGRVCFDTTYQYNEIYVGDWVDFNSGKGKVVAISKGPSPLCATLFVKFCSKEARFDPIDDIRKDLGLPPLVEMRETQGAKAELGNHD